MSKPYGGLDNLEEDVLRFRVLFYEGRLSDYINEKDPEFHRELRHTLIHLIRKTLPFLADLGHPIPPPDEYIYYKWP